MIFTRVNTFFGESSITIRTFHRHLRTSIFEMFLKLLKSFKLVSFTTFKQTRNRRQTRSKMLMSFFVRKSLTTLIAIKVYFSQQTFYNHRDFASAERLLSTAWTGVFLLHPLIYTFWTKVSFAFRASLWGPHDILTDYAKQIFMRLLGSCIFS